MHSSIDLEPLHRLHTYCARFPSEIAESAIKAYSGPGDSVHDPFCGSGTTLTAGLALGRRVVGTDIDRLAGLLSTVKCEPAKAGEYATWQAKFDTELDVAFDEVARHWPPARSPEPGTLEILDALMKRRGRGGLGQPDKTRKEGRISELLGRGLMTYAERVVLADHADTPWRMGHGTIAPYELLTGSGSMAPLDAAMAAMHRLVEHGRFVFVPSADGDRLLLTLGMALRPLEYAIVHDDRDRMSIIVGNGHYSREYADKAKAFANSVGPEIVVGVYRTYADVPAQVFYAHRDLAHEAAIIAMADSVLQSHRGFPTLIDVADIACKTYTGMDAFTPAVQAGYSRSGSPLLFLPERDTRG